KMASRSNSRNSKIPMREKQQKYSARGILGFFMAFFVALAAQSAPVVPVDVTKEKHVQVVRVNATDQPYDFFHPWSKKTPYTMHALGPVIANKRVLVTAELVANSNYVELEKAESGEKTAATVEVVDYEANLALLKPADEKFLADIKPLEI